MRNSAQTAAVGRLGRNSRSVHAQECTTPLRMIVSTTNDAQRGIDSQQALPIWTPAWPTWMEMTSRMLRGGDGGWRKKTPGLVGSSDSAAPRLIYCVVWFATKPSNNTTKNGPDGEPLNGSFIVHKLNVIALQLGEAVINAWR